MYYRCCILVDATRGLCKGDKMLVRFLSRYNIPWLVVLTKGDLLDCPTLARCVLAVQLDLAQYVTPPDGEAAVIPSAGSATRGRIVGPDRSAIMRGAVQNEESCAGEVGSGGSYADTDADADISSTDTVCDEDDIEHADFSDEEAHGEHRESNFSASNDIAAGDEQDMGDADGSTPTDETTDDVEDSGADAEEEEEATEEEKCEAEDFELPNRRLVPVVVVSSSTGAGVQQLWKRLCAIAKNDSVLPPGVAPGTGHVVREHRMAQTLRRRHAVQDSIDRRGEAASSAVRSPRGQGRDVRPTLRPVKLVRNRRSVRARIREAAEEELKAAKAHFESKAM